MLNPTSKRSPWWDLAIAVVPAVLAAGAVLIPWWLDRRAEGETDEEETEREA